MNCLAGEEQIFKISNEKESCTQGIDISEKWLTVTDFSKIDGGVSCTGKTKVGFVDAEGQGDRDVSYPFFMKATGDAQANDPAADD